MLLGLGPATGAASGLQPGEPGARNGKASPERTKGVRRYFSKKPEKRREEATPWEQSGDEDLVGDVQGKCGTKRLFWKGSLDSQGCPTASAAEVKDIFRHIILVSMCIAILSALVRNLGFVNFVAFYRAMFTEVDRWLQALGAYGEDLDGLTKAIKEHDPLFDPKGVVDFQKPTAPGACPPYFILVDHEHKEVSMYIRGLNLIHRPDYVALMNNRRGEKVRQPERLLGHLNGCYESDCQLNLINGFCRALMGAMCIMACRDRLSGLSSTPGQC